ncbi:MAG: carboxypeptidase-like regulatory domain-containing protein [Candidatus Bathyarchaeia archaeon]
MVEAQSPQQYYGELGGEITGRVVGVDGYPVDWAAVHASDGQQTYQVFSGMSGVYLMRVPVGTYSVTVDVPGYRADGVTVNVTANSSNTANFQLEVAVPEFQSNITPWVMTLTLAVTLIFISKRGPLKGKKTLD